MTRRATCQACREAFDAPRSGRLPKRCPRCRWQATPAGKVAADPAEARELILQLLRRTEAFCRGMRRALGEG